jgi:hypothetical protein
VTTTVCGALKEAQKKYGADLGIVVCGGKGATSRQTPRELADACSRTGDDGDRLIYASRLSAKIDSAAVQDGYQLYHHCFFFVPGPAVSPVALPARAPADRTPVQSRPTDGAVPAWCVIQQGMNDATGYARRYHWASDDLRSFVNDPHAAVVSEQFGDVLNLVAGEGEASRGAMTELSRQQPDKLFREIRPLIASGPLPLFERMGEPFAAAPGSAGAVPDLHLPRRHTIRPEDLHPSQLRKALEATYEHPPADFEALLGETGVGPATLRSLALLAEVIFQAPASRRDPAVYSFAHGGKDGHPFPVARQPYDENVERLRGAIAAARIGETDKLDALRRLGRWLEHP